MGKKKKKYGTLYQLTAPPMPKLVMTYRDNPVVSYRKEDGYLYQVPLSNDDRQYLRCLREIIFNRLEQAKLENERLNCESNCNMTYEIASINGMIGGLKFCLEELDKVLYPDEDDRLLDLASQDRLISREELGLERLEPHPPIFVSY